MFLQIQNYHSSDIDNTGLNVFAGVKILARPQYQVKNNYMHARIIWALSFWWTSDLNGSLWGKYISFWVTPAKPSTSKPMHLPLVHLWDSTFLTHHLPGGKRAHNRSLLQMKYFLLRGLGILLPGWQMIWRHKSETYSFCHLVWDAFIVISTLNFFLNFHALN